MNSLRFEELNKKCKKIRIKKFLKIFTVFFLLIFITVVLFFLFYSKIHDTNSISKKTLIAKHDKNSSIVKVAHKKTKHKAVTKVIKKDQAKEDKILLNPTLNMSDLNTHSNIDKKIKSTIVKKRVVKPMVKIEKKIKINKKQLKISVKNIDTESVLMKNYKILRNYKSALKLAAFYFGRKDYKKCIYWAKIASQLGRTADKPWIFYAKAKYNLNQKNDAIRSLQTYLNYFNSKEVYELLKKFQKERK